MARSASSRRGSGRKVSPERHSLTSLHSLSEQEELSCRERVARALGTIYNYTIAGCIYPCCICCRRRSLYEELDNTNEVDTIKQKLKFHFMNPFEKWKYPKRRRFPWKMALQISIIVLATIQLYIFAGSKSQFNAFLATNTETFQTLFITNKMDDDPTTNYYDNAPLSTITTMDKLWDQLEFTKEAYYNITSAVGPYGYGWDSMHLRDGDIPPPKLKIVRYSEGYIKPDLKFYNFSDEHVEDIYKINDTSVREQLDDHLDGPRLMSIIRMELSFTLSSIYLHTEGNPLCCQFSIRVHFENKVFSGKILVSIKVVPQVSQCSKNSTSDFQRGWRTFIQGWVTSLDVVVLILTLIHTFLCMRSLYASQKFSLEVRHYFKRHLHYKLRFSECLPLYNLWFLGAIVGDLLVAVGSIMKIFVYYQLLNTVEGEDITSILFGLGVFCQWCALLRFLSYFDKYNMLLLTLRISLPSVVRFMVCAGILYIAFLLLGWLVLGPYHPKFRDPSVTSECLYSLINGDDMFNTFIQMSDLSLPAFLFSKIYLYLFISLFIYVVLSVFISLISDTYETLHEHWTVRSRGLLHDFAHDRLGLLSTEQLHHCHQHTEGGGGGQRGDRSDSEFEYLASTNVLSPGTPQVVVTNGSPLLVAPSNIQHRRSTLLASTSSTASSRNVPGVIITNLEETN